MRKEKVQDAINEWSVIRQDRQKIIIIAVVHQIKKKASSFSFILFQCERYKNESCKKNLH